MGTPITPLTLPGAVDTQILVTYTLTGPNGMDLSELPGLTFDAATRVLSGTPMTAAGARDFTYLAATGGQARTTHTISITVEGPVANTPTGFTLSLFDNDIGSANPPIVSTLFEGFPQNVLATAVPTPAGSAFAVDQQITFAVAAPPTRPPASAADPYVSYTPVTPGTIPLAVGAASASYGFSLTTIDDNFDHADFPLTVTVTATPSNITGMATLTLTDNDISIVTTLATTSVVAAATTTYDVTLGEAPPATATVTVASQGTATATVSPATLTFSTTNWNTARTVTVTGVAAGTTTIRHTAPDSVGFAFVPNDVAVTVTADTAPTFADGASIADQFYTVGTTISTLTLPEVETAGNGATTYTLTPAIPGLTFDPATRALSGTPTTAAPETEYTYTATDEDDDTAILTFNITAQDLAFPSASGIGALPGGAPTLRYENGLEITPTTFPAATGGTEPYAYTLTDPPTGLTFDATSRVLTGTPVAATAEYNGTYMVTDSASPPATATQSVTFIVCAVGGNAAGTGICFPSAVYTTLVLSPVPNQSYALDQPITAQTYPAAAGGTTGGTAERPTSIYSLTPLPSGLTFDPATRVLSGTPDTSGEVDTTYEVRDAGSPRSLGRHASRPITITISPPNPVALTGTPPATQTYTVGTPITSLTLPGAVDTDILVTYTLTGPNGMDLSELPGLTFDAATRVLSGTPMTAAGARDFTYLAATANSNRTAHTISITVVPIPPSSLTLSATPSTVMESADPTPITVTATFVGGTFAEERVVSVSSLGGILGGTAIPGPDFTVVSATNLTIPANAESGSVVIPFTARVDSNVEADGETVVLGGSLRTADGSAVDSSISMVTITITINDPDTAPVFAADASIDDQNYIAGLAITALTLPAVATPGNGATTYMLTPAIAGLTLNPTTRVLTGTPMTAAAVDGIHLHGHRHG